MYATATRFVKIASPAPAVDYLADVLGRHLRADESVLWQISGSSAIKVAAAVAQKLAGAPLGRLTVTLVDERPGPVGRADSNWHGLEQAGFELTGATLQPVLTGADTATDTAAFDHFLHEQYDAADYKIGLFGIGPDGHTAGLPAAHAHPSDRLADHYEAGDFRRISSTPAAIARLDEAVAFVMGEAKHDQISRLQFNLPYAEQSAQALKLAPKLTVFNDFKGEPA